MKLRQRSTMQSSSFSPVPGEEKEVDNYMETSRRGCATSCIRKIEEIQCCGKPFLSGVEGVVFGTRPAAELISIFGVRPPRYLFYMMSGIVCDIIQFSLDILLHFVFRIQDATVCWSLGFFLSIVFRHTSHRYLVFGDYVGGYWNSLGRMYVGYSIIISLSTLFNLIMTRWAKFPHYVAWIVTLLWTGIVNYFILKKIWSFGGNQTNTDRATELESAEEPFSDVEVPSAKSTETETDEEASQIV